MKDILNTIPEDMENKLRPFQTANYDEYGLRQQPLKVKMSDLDYKQLKRIRDEHGRRSLGDAVVYLIRTYV